MKRNVRIRVCFAVGMPMLLCGLLVVILMLLATLFPEEAGGPPPGGIWAVMCALAALLMATAFLLQWAFRYDPDVRGFPPILDSKGRKPGPEKSD